MQVEELLIAEPEAAQALGSVGFLGKFLSPASPSEVARQLGMPANLAHHHVQKFLRLGLLFRVGRKKGRVLYQLSARTFKVPERVAEVMDYAKAIHAITDRYLDANERSTARQERENPGWTICSFGGKEQPSAPPQTKPPIAEARPAYLYSRTLPLSPERYRQLLARIEALLQAEEPQSEKTAAPCTLTFLACEGAGPEGATDSTILASFLDLDTEKVRTAGTR